jgi:hypothetical protein
MITHNTLSLEHIKYVLGVELTLVESRNVPLDKMKVIVERQIIYESFFSDLKAKIGDVKNKVVTKITDLKDFFITVARILATPEALRIAVEKLINNTKEIARSVLDILERAKTKIRKLQSVDITNKFNIFIDKIFSISVEWIKFLAVITVGSAFTWIKEKFNSFIKSIKTGADLAMDTSKDGITITEQLTMLLDNLGVTGASGADGLIKSVSSLAGFASNISSIAAISQAVYTFTQPVVDELKAGFSADGDSFELPINENIDYMEELHEGEFCPRCLIDYILEHVNTLEEAEYKGRKVQLGKPMAGDVKKFKVYVKNKSGKVVKVNFGQKGVKIKKNNPARRKSFRARHKCHTAKDRTTPRYWSCRKW